MFWCGFCYVFTAKKCTIPSRCTTVSYTPKHTHNSVPVRTKHRKWPQFIWNNDHYQFTSLPRGLTSAPRLITKLLKLALTNSRESGILVSCYIDDCIFIASSKEELLGNANYALHLFDSLELTTHMSKSVLIPTQVVDFLV